ncbi:Embryo defective 2735 protein [Rhynchospora pubera]|uniref:Embryo defective 2735 protein n=1 Tax=Rhynchospora pubera TaxID=906938 RepID=A0AAV8EQY6_9POAL|nr:Embryo defective 2735 protein [Rhynchospora pubera]
MKLRVVCRKLYNYMRYDLKEIAFPSSLPDPPGYEPEPKLTIKQKWHVLKEASRLYAVSWVRDIGPDLRPEEHKTEASEKKDGSKQETEMSIVEELAVAARGGMETLRPALQRVYMMRASAYRDALRAFIEGYQEGIKQVMEERENSEKDENQGDKTNKSV